jgi:hypothetical protein
MQKRFAYETAIGTFYIVEHEKVFYPMFGSKTLGGYVTAQHAVDDLARGRAFKVPGVEDIAALGIPSDLGQWLKLSD